MHILRLCLTRRVGCPKGEHQAPPLRLGLVLHSIVGLALGSRHVSSINQGKTNLDSTRLKLNVTDRLRLSGLDALLLSVGGSRGRLRHCNVTVSIVSKYFR